MGYTWLHKEMEANSPRHCFLYCRGLLLLAWALCRFLNYFFWLSSLMASPLKVEVLSPYPSASLFWPLSHDPTDFLYFKKFVCLFPTFLSSSLFYCHLDPDFSILYFSYFILTCLCRWSRWNCFIFLLHQAFLSNIPKGLAQLHRQW